MRTLRRRSQQGQAIVLGALSLLAVAVVVFGIMNINRSVHERIRLQNHADSTAFSMAVQEARVFNYYAYSNRAMANAFVIMATLHAYQSEAAMTVDAEFWAFIGMIQIFGTEIGDMECCDGLPCCADPHLDHAIDAIEDAIGYVESWENGSIGNKVNGIDDEFDNAMKALGRHVQTLRLSQTLAKRALQVMVTGLLPAARQKKLRDANLGANNSHADDATSIMGTVKNSSTLNSAYYDDSDDTKKRVMTHVINATRPAYTWDRGGLEATVNAMIVLQPILDKIKDDAETGDPSFTLIEMPNMGVMSGGRTAFTDDALGITQNDASADSDNHGKKIHSYDWAFGTMNFHCGTATILFPTMLMAGPGELLTGSSGFHRAAQGIFQSENDPHDSSHDKVAPSGTDDNDNFKLSEFEEFNATDDDEFNQPIVFAAADGETRFNDYNKSGPWEITTQSGHEGEVGIDMGGGDSGKGTVHLANKDKAHAIAKARAYYHRIGDWKEPPNFWNPYWRAKLEAPTPTEAVMAAGQDGTSAEVVGAMAYTPDRAAVGVRENTNH